MPVAFSPTYFPDLEHLFRRRELSGLLAAARDALLQDGLPPMVRAEAALHYGKALLYTAHYANHRAHLDEVSAHFRQAQAALPQTEEGAFLSLAFDFWAGKCALFARQYDAARQILQHLAQKAAGAEALLGYELRALIGLAHVERLSGRADQAAACLGYAKNLLEGCGPKHPALPDWQVQAIALLIRQQDFEGIQVHASALLASARQQGDAEQEFVALNALAAYHGAKSQYREAMGYTLDALHRSRSIGYRAGEANCLINAGTIYAALFNYGEALRRYQLVLSELDDVLEHYAKIALYNNIGNIHYSQGDFSAAQGYFKKGYDTALCFGYAEMQAHCAAQLGRAALALGDADMAEMYSLQAHEYALGKGQSRSHHISLLSLASLHSSRGNYAEGLRFAEQGLAAARHENDMEHILKAHELIAGMYEAQRNYVEAFQWQKLYTAISQQYNREWGTRQVQDVEIRFLLQEKEKALDSLRKENQYQAQLLAQGEQIKAQNLQLSRANEELRQFAYAVSHDLREPLRMIGSYTQLLQRRADALLRDEDSQLFMRYISEGAQRMSQLIADLLSYTTLNRYDVLLVPVDTARVLDQVCDNLQVLIQESQAQIDIAPLPRLMAQESLLLQLLQNLIANAIKFRKPDLPVRVHIYTRPGEAPDEALLCVEDNGIGIPEAQQERVFGLFQRLHKRSAYEGTGIGLAICQKIAHKLGGNIWVESEEGRGSCFVVQLRQAPEERQ